MHKKPASFSLLDESSHVSEDEQEELENGGAHNKTSSRLWLSDSQLLRIRNGSFQGSFAQTPLWPQSFRNSMDMYSHFGSPSSQRSHPKSTEGLGSLSNSSLTKTENEHAASYENHYAEPQNFSYHQLADYNHRVPGHCSTWQGTLNGINVMCGVGILSTPYALKEGGWLSLGLFLMLGLISFYTGILLRSCLESHPGLETYSDIGQAAFGTYGRVTISIILYMELYACCVEFIILEGDNISAMFPEANLSIVGLHLTGTELFIILTALCVLPTVWLRDLSLLCYVSAAGVVASVVVVICVLWVGIVGVGFQRSGPALNLSTLPISLGLYGFCYSGHSLFPNVYSSLKNPSQYPKVLMISFVLCTILYGGIAVLGFTMFGDDTQSQITLNLPDQYVASKVAVWCTIINPFTKYPLILVFCMPSNVYFV